MYASKIRYPSTFARKETPVLNTGTRSVQTMNCDEVPVADGLTQPGEGSPEGSRVNRNCGSWLPV
ncbi:hypothetical protein D3C83_160630 [compost metagenome]